MIYSHLWIYRDSWWHHPKRLTSLRSRAFFFVVLLEPRTGVLIVCCLFGSSGFATSFCALYLDCTHSFQLIFRKLEAILFQCSFSDRYIQFASADLPKEYVVGFSFVVCNSSITGGVDSGGCYAFRRLSLFALFSYFIMIYSIGVSLNLCHQCLCI